MLELLLCSMLTILPDYLYRRLVQGKRLGKEITFFSVWFELRWGIVACLMLTISLITLIFHFRPSSNTGVTAGSSCIVNAYTSNHELISSGKLSSAKSFGLHAVDAVGLVHAMLLRIQALLLPIKTLVLSGH